MGQILAGQIKAGWKFLSRVFFGRSWVDFFAAGWVVDRPHPPPTLGPWVWAWGTVPPPPPGQRICGPAPLGGGGGRSPSACPRLPDRAGQGAAGRLPPMVLRPRLWPGANARGCPPPPATDGFLLEAGVSSFLLFTTGVTRNEGLPGPAEAEKRRMLWRCFPVVLPGSVPVTQVKFLIGGTQTRFSCFF